MRLPPEAITEFQLLWSEQFGQKLSSTEAQHYAESLMGLFGTVVFPTVKNSAKCEDPP